MLTYYLAGDIILAVGANLLGRKTSLVLSFSFRSGISSLHTNSIYRNYLSLHLLNLNRISLLRGAKRGMLSVFLIFSYCISRKCSWIGEFVCNDWICFQSICFRTCWQKFHVYFWINWNPKCFDLLFASRNKRIGYGRYSRAARESTK